MSSSMIWFGWLRRILVVVGSYQDDVWLQYTRRSRGERSPRIQMRRRGDKLRSFARALQRATSVVHRADATTSSSDSPSAIESPERWRAGGAQLRRCGSPVYCPTCNRAACFSASNTGTVTWYPGLACGMNMCSVLASHVFLFIKWDRWSGLHGMPSKSRLQSTERDSRIYLSK